MDAVLKAVGTILALIVVAVVLVALLRSLWSVWRSVGILFVPFVGAERLGVWVSGILAQRLKEVDEEFRELWVQIRKEGEEQEQEESKGPYLPPAQTVDLAPSEVDVVPSKVLSLRTLEPQAPGSGSFTVGAASFSPDRLFALFYSRVLTIVARRTIRGQVDRLGDTVRLSTTLTTRGDRAHSTAMVGEVKELKQLLTLIDDTAFEIVFQLRLKAGHPESQTYVTHANTWEGYRTFLEAHAHHLRFERTGHLAHLEMAIEKYQHSIALEQDYYEAHYNLGTLLYSRYTAEYNAQAIEHLRHASRVSLKDLKALALAQLARSYVQQVHRYGYGEPLLAAAEEASDEALRLVGDLKAAGPQEELDADDVAAIWHARGMALQMIDGREQEALKAHQKAVECADGESAKELRLKSMALNGMGYLYMTRYDDLQEAEKLFKSALESNRNNKMPHANLAELYKRQKNYEAALNESERALALDPVYVNGHNEMGTVHLAMARDARDNNRHEDAEESLEKARREHEAAIDLVPEEQLRHRAEVHRRFADAYREYGFDKEAQELTEAQHLHPGR